MPSEKGNYAGCAAAVGGGAGLGALNGSRLGPWGAVGGAIAGGALAYGSTSGKGGACSRVICTHFFQKGKIEKDLWRADLEFTFRNLSPRTVRGYQYWAIPYVKLMRKSRFAEKIMLPLAKWRAEELAYKVGVRTTGSLKGKLVRLIGEPLCFLIGHFVGEQDWESLWSQSPNKL